VFLVDARALGFGWARWTASRFCPIRCGSRIEGFGRLGADTHHAVFVLFGPFHRGGYPSAPTQAHRQALSRRRVLTRDRCFCSFLGRAACQVGWRGANLSGGVGLGSGHRHSHGNDDLRPAARDQALVHRPTVSPSVAVTNSRPDWSRAMGRTPGGILCRVSVRGLRTPGARPTSAMAATTGASTSLSKGQTQRLLKARESGAPSTRTRERVNLPDLAHDLSFGVVAAVWPAGLLSRALGFAH